MALIATSSPVALSPATLQAIERGPNYLSAVVYWEVVLKCMKGKLDVGSPEVWWQGALDQLAAIPLSIHPNHVSELRSLPPLHQDPFDRILIAQAISEELVLLTTDRQIPRYSCSGLQVLHSA